jgi:hypothetical protein
MTSPPPFTGLIFWEQVVGLLLSRAPQNKKQQKSLCEGSLGDTKT